MELFGKVVNTGSSLNLNTEPELLVNTKNGRITVKQPVIDVIGENALIGFGYDANKEHGSLAYLYVAEDGCKVGSKGTVSTRHHSDTLKNAFLGEESETTRLMLSVDLENTVDFNGITLYPLALKEELADLTRTVAKTEEETVTPEAKIEADIAAAEHTNDEDWNDSDAEEVSDVDNATEPETESSLG